MDMTSINTSAVGTIAALWRFPVKSMKGERLQELDVTQTGVLGDRAYALIDADTGKVVSAKSIRLFPDLLQCRAEFIEAPKRGGEMPPARITLSTGKSVRSDGADVDQVLSEHFHRSVKLARAAPDDFTIDQYHPDIEDVDPGGNRDKVVEQKLGAALFAALGAPSPVPQGSFLDVFPMSVMTTSTLARLNELAPKSRFDERRFRMNVIVKTDQPGFVENGWVGRELVLGGGVRLNVALLDPRCVMTTLAQEDLPQDTEVLRTLVRHNRVELPGLGPYPCAGAYAVVTQPGSIRVGDPVRA
jgi:uncharacterized protein